MALLIIAVLIVGLPFYVLAGLLGWKISFLLNKRRLEEEKLKEGEHRSLIRKIVLFAKRWTLPISLQAILMISACIPIGILSQSIAARRVYEADRDIVAPYLSLDQRTQIQADFSGIYTKAQYQALMNRLNTIAIAHNVKLRSESY
jgi:hypothetical protein